MSSEIPLSAPDIGERELELVTKVLTSGRLSIGPMQERFEELVSDRVGVPHAVACSSGTAGLHLVLEALGIGEGDEVITTPFSFIASTNCIRYVGATPVFVDIDPATLNMDPGKVEDAITERTKAILAVEVFGNPIHMDRYRRIADKHEIRLVEDSCEGLGGRYKGRSIGTFGHAGVFGFYPNKQITTGEGGMIVTSDDHLAELCRSLRNHGRSSAHAHPWSGMRFAHDRIGYNYRLPELSAALGVAQMERIDELLEARSLVADMYTRRLMTHPDLILPTVDSETDMSWFVYVVRLSSRYAGVERDRIVESMRRHDVAAAPYFPCIHLQPPYRKLYGFAPGLCPIAEAASQRTIALPFFTKLREDDAEIAASTLEVMMSRENLSRPEL